MEILLDVLKWSLIVGAAAVLLAALKPAMDKRYRAKWRYWAYLALAAALVLSPVQWGELLPHANVLKMEPAVVVEVPKAVFRAEVKVPGAPAAVGTAKGESDQSTPQSSGAKRTESASFSLSLETVWLAGAGLFALYHLTGTLWLKRKLRRWGQTPKDETARAFEDMCKEMGLKRRPRLTVSSCGGSPMVIGVVRPLLALPGEGYGPQELRFILRHELTHYKRRDLWYQAVLLLANAVHWFNPLIYLLRRTAAADLELICDDAVVAGCGTAERRAYSETLLASLHRQKGLPALSTHFYGGKKVMMARFRNILGPGARKWGAAALAGVIVLTVLAACAFGLREEKPVELTEDEIAWWQEKLEGELNGYVTRFYTDVRYLPLPDLLYADHVGRELQEGEREAVISYLGEDPGVDITALGREDVERFLEDTAGYGIEDFECDLGCWLYLEDYDTYYHIHGDTNYVAGVEVTGGSRRGDTITLEVELPYGNTIGVTYAGGTEMTIVDGKVRSFTNPLYTGAEPFLRDYMEAGIQEKLAEGGQERGRYNMVHCWYGCGIGDKTYYVWQVMYELGLEGREDPVWDEASLIVSLSLGSDKPVLEEQKPGWSCREEGYTGWEEYCCTKLFLGMEPTPAMEGWPELTEEFREGFKNGHYTFATDWQDVALSYLSDQGYTPPLTSSAGPQPGERLEIIRVFNEPTDVEWYDALETAALIQAHCGGGDRYLLLRKALIDDLGTVWQVAGDIPVEDAPPLTVDAPGFDGGYSYSPEDSDGSKRIPDTPDEDMEYAMSCAEDYLESAGAISYLAEQGHPVTEAEIVDLEQEGAYTWDFYDSEVQVWRMSYHVKVEDPETLPLVGAMDMDADGWVTGIEGGAGDPYFIISVYRGEVLPEYRLLETAPSYVNWEEGYCWETYAAAHTLLGLELSPKLNGWPDITTDFILGLEKGGSDYTSGWESCARRYGEEVLGLTDFSVNSLLRVYTGDKENNDEDRIVELWSERGGGIVKLVLSHWYYHYGADMGQMVSFWEVVGSGGS